MSYHELDPIFPAVCSVCAIMLVLTSYKCSRVAQNTYWYTQCHVRMVLRKVRHANEYVDGD